MIAESSNRLIASLGEAEWQRCKRYFERVDLAQRKEIFAPDDPIEHLWFPESGVCSQVIESSDGGSVEVAIVGREGMIGLPAIFGVTHAATRAMAQMNMSALRIRVADFLEHLNGEHALLQRLERYAAVRLSVLFQVAACNRLHRTEQRLIRWLLMMRDRVEQDRLPITHEFLAQMMGTRRSAVTEVAQRLQHQGLIEHERGTIVYKDVRGLEQCACECFGIIRGLYRLLEQEM